MSGETGYLQLVFVFERLVVSPLDGASLLQKSRKTKAGRTAGGGVALVFDKTKVSFTEFNIPQNKFEIVAAVGNIPGNKRKIAVIGSYVPPKYKAEQNAAFLEKLADTISKIKLKFPNPLIITGADYNNRQHIRAHEDNTDMVQINTAPTRKDACLNIMYCNFVHDIVELEVRDPLVSDNGIMSDHDVVFASFKIKHTHIFNKRKITVRPRTKKGEKTIAEMLVAVDWTSVAVKASPNEKVLEMNRILSGIMDSCFPEKVLTIRDTDDPWINKEIRRLIKKRKREFKKYGRSRKWKKIKKIVARKIAEEKEKFIERGKMLAKEKGDSAAYYKMLNSVKDGNAPKTSILGLSNQILQRKKWQMT